MHVHRRRLEVEERRVEAAESLHARQRTACAGWPDASSDSAGWQTGRHESPLPSLSGHRRRADRSTACARCPAATRCAVPSFFAGWLTSELAPHNLAMHGRRHRRRTCAGGRGRAGPRRPGRAGAQRRVGRRAAWTDPAGHEVGRRRRAGADVGTARRATSPGSTRRRRSADLATPWRNVLLPWHASDDPACSGSPTSTTPVTAMPAPARRLPAAASPGSGRRC